MDIKRFASDAGTFFNRAKQYTEEKLGQAERTELDAHFENLLKRADMTRIWTERILENTRTVLQPNPNVRMEEFVFDKLDKKKRDRQNNAEFLGSSMVDAGNEFGPGTAYGSALVKCGQTQLKIGQADRDLLQTAANNFIQPLRAFLDGDMKTVQKERKTLESKRLDLDVAKAKMRRAKSEGSKVQDPDAAVKAEAELRQAQAEFDRQAEITKLLLEGISSTHAHHLRCLHDFIEAQTTYYAQCQQYMQDLQRQLGSFSMLPQPSAPPLVSGGGPTSPTMHVPPNNNWSAGPGGETTGPPHQARVLYDYDAADMKELSLKADEIITVFKLLGPDDDWMMGVRGSQRGRVPSTYLMTID